MKQLTGSMIDYLIELWLRDKNLELIEIKKGEKKDEEKDSEMVTLGA